MDTHVAEDLAGIAEHRGVQTQVGTSDGGEDCGFAREIWLKKGTDVCMCCSRSPQAGLDLGWDQEKLGRPI